MGVLQLLAPDQSTVLFDFDDATGAANPSTLITDLGIGVDLGTIQPAHNLFSGSQFGAESLGYSHPPVEVTIPLKARAATDDALWAGLGQLARYLTSASTDQPIYLKWTDLTETRYMDLIGVLELPQILRGQTLGGLASLRKNSMGPVPIRLLRQPWMRGPAVSVSGVTVPNDPATSTKVRVFPLTVTGDLPTPGRVRVQMDTGSTVQRVLIANRARKSKASTVFSDYLSSTGFFQCESTNRSWTITLGTNTSSVADANASGGNVARVTHATNPTIYARRVRATRTANMDSLRGSWDVWLRVKAAADRDYRLKLLWGPGTSDPPAYSLDEVVHDTSANGTPGTFGYVELNMGTIHLPETVSLSGLALEIWTRQNSGTAQNLDLDLIWLTPADSVSTVVVPGGSAITTLGKDLTSPPDQITADPVWTAGTITGNAIRLDADLDAAGWGPNTGTDLPDGRHRVTFVCDFKTNGAMVAELRVTNVTDNTEAVSKAYTAATVPSGLATVVLQFDAVATKFYQPQVTLTDVLAGWIDVVSISVEFVPSLAINESVRTDPTRFAVDRLDSSGNVAGYLEVEGPVPLTLEPGDNHIMVRADEVPLALYDESENKLARTPTVSVTYDPRYAL